jgi:signal transduction histidine kinase
MIFEPLSPASAGTTPAELTREIELLLDESLCSVRHALAHLDGDPPLDPVALRDRLGAAESSIERITVLLEGATRSGEAEAELRPSTPLGAALRDLVALLAPIAIDGEVHVDVQIDESIADWPVGPLGPVLHHALRSAIEAAAGGTSCVRRAIVSIDRHRDMLRMHVVDSGPGRPPAGSMTSAPASGLARARRIVDALGGRMRLMNIPFRDGTVFEADVPLSRLGYA